MTGLAGGVREGPNIAKYGPRFWLLSPLEAPKWVQDPGNGLKSIRGSWGDHLASISGVLLENCVFGMFSASIDQFLASNSSSIS